MPTDDEQLDEKPKAKTKGDSPSKLSDKDLLARIRSRFVHAEEADHTNREKAREDMRFLHEPGAQWEPNVKTARGSRPCYEFNKTRIKAKRIVNEMRANRAAGKVRGVEDTDKKTAEIMEGLGRNILQVSDFDTIADYAGEYQVGAGIGAWRIVTEYSEDSFDQDICIKAVPDPFNLYWDAASVDPLHRDAEDWWLLDFITNSQFEERYGKKARKVDFDTATTFDDDADWKTEIGTRICEYHWKERYDKRLLQLVDGRVIDAASPEGELVLAGLAVGPDGQPLMVRRERMAVCHRILMCTASGDAILEGPVELKGKYHRFIAFHGEWKILEGKAVWCGVTRYAKDAQRAYNVASTAITETVANSPLSYSWVTTEQAKGNTAQWNKALAENMPWLVYNPDMKSPGPPQRVGGADVPVALLQEAQIRDQELKDVMGVYDASLGDKGNETSGRAISRRNEQGQIVNFNFPDNMAKAKQRTVEIVNDLIPFYYDSERTVRVIGHDGAEDYVKVNTVGVDPKTGQPVMLNDLTRGKYDVTVTVGPSFATQRQEASETYAALAAQDEMLMATSADLVYQAMDLPYSDQIAERRKAMLPPQILAIIDKDKEESPEVARAKAIVAQGQQQLQEQGQLVQAAAAEAQGEKADADKAKADVQVAIANLKVQEANLATDVANFKTLVAQTEAQMAQANIAKDGEVEKATLSAQLDTALGQITQEAAQLFQQYATQLAQMHGMALQTAQPQVVVANQPKRKRAVTSRVNGQLITEIQEIADTPAPGVQ